MQAKLLHHLIGFPVRTPLISGFITQVYDAEIQITASDKINTAVYFAKVADLTHYHLDAFLSKAPATISDLEFEQKIAQSTTLQQIALLRLVQYHGLNSFYQSLQQQLLDKGSISFKQMRAVLRDMLRAHRANTTPPPVAPKATTTEYTTALNSAEQRSGIDRGAFQIDLASIAMIEPESTEPAAPQAVETYLPNGFYTVVYNDAGEYRTFKVTDADWANGKPAGTQAVFYLSGPDNSSDYTFYAFLIGREFKPTFKLRNAHDLSYALVKLLAPDAFKVAGKTYALRANKCFICGRKLTTPISAAAGIGPDCAANIGVDQQALAVLNISEESRLQQSRAERAKAQSDVDELFPD